MVEDRPSGGSAANPVRARPRALRYISLPCFRLIQPTATNGRLITSSKTSDAAATPPPVAAAGDGGARLRASRVLLACGDRSTLSNRETGLPVPAPGGSLRPSQSTQIAPNRAKSSFFQFVKILKAFAPSDFGFRPSVLFAGSSWAARPRSLLNRKSFPLRRQRVGRSVYWRHGNDTSHGGRWAAPGNPARVCAGLDPAPARRHPRRRHKLFCSVDIPVGGFTEHSSSVFPQPRLRPSPACMSVPKSKWVTVGNTFEIFSSKVGVSRSR
jgi:hypothetical protein